MDLNESVKDPIDELELTEGGQTDDGLDGDELDGEVGTDGEGQEVEIVLEGDSGSQPDPKQSGIRKRINKLNAKVNAAVEGEVNATEALELERQRNKLLQLALEQKNATEPSGPPDPNDFDDGAKDAKYVEALEVHNRRFFESEMERHAAEQPKPTDSRALERRQTQHYEAAEKLGVKDYSDVEDVAIGILGNQTVNQLIADLDNSPAILYYLGKNPSKAESIAEMLSGSNPVKGVLEIGALSAGLVSRPKAKRKAAPDPDDDLSGASVSRNSKVTRGPSGATFT